MLDETIKTFENIKQSPSNKKSKTGFSLNLPRNDIMINRNESNILSYIEPEKINSRRSVQSLDFKRMRTRNFNDLLIQSKFNPGVATYNPNFDAVSSSRKQSKLFFDSSYSIKEFGKSKEKQVNDSENVE
jgi:hypothetical protein